MNSDIKRVSVVFKTLANINRIKIIKLLKKNDKLAVHQIAKKLKISVPSTSRHLILLNDLDVLNFEGKSNQVFYSINSEMPKDFKEAINFLEKYTI